jgi:hypothetical protein
VPILIKKVIILKGLAHDARGARPEIGQQANQTKPRQLTSRSDTAKYEFLESGIRFSPCIRFAARYAPWPMLLNYHDKV